MLVACINKIERCRGVVGLACQFHTLKISGSNPDDAKFFFAGVVYSYYYCCFFFIPFLPTERFIDIFFLPAELGNGDGQ